MWLHSYKKLCNNCGAILNKKTFKKAKWLSEEVLQTAEKRRESKGKGEKERFTQLYVEFRRIARR